ncbi:MAG: hypothetical protein ACUVQP_08025 [Bacteroidales bacterium]
MKFFKILVLGIVMLILFVSSFAYQLSLDENGRPYGIYLMRIVGSGGPNTAGSLYLLDSSGNNKIFTPYFGDKYYLGTSSVISWYNGVTTKTNVKDDPIPIAIYGYPSSSQNLFENNNDNPIYVSKSGITVTKILSTGLTYDLITPPSGSSVLVTSAAISTSSTAGVAKILFLTTNNYIAVLYSERAKTFNTGEIAQKGQTNEVVRIANNTNYDTFFTVTYRIVQ